MWSIDWVVFDDNIESATEEDDLIHPQNIYYHEQDCKMLHFLLKSGMLGPSSDIILSFNLPFAYIKEITLNIVTQSDVVDLLNFDWLNVSIIQVWELFLRDTYATFFQTPAIFSFLYPSKIARVGIQRDPNFVAQYVGDAFIAEGKKSSTERTKYIFAPYIEVGLCKRSIQKTEGNEHYQCNIQVLPKDAG